MLMMIIIIQYDEGLATKFASYYDTNFIVTKFVSYYDTNFVVARPSSSLISTESTKMYNQCFGNFCLITHLCENPVV